eukprot:g476.t1
MTSKRKTSTVGNGRGSKSGAKAKLELTKQEIYGWYSYDFANSCASSVVDSIFLPLLLLYVAKDMACPHIPSAVMYNGWSLKDQYFLNDGSFKATGGGYVAPNLTTEECNAAGDWSFGGNCVNYNFRNLSTPCVANVSYCDIHKTRLGDSWDYCRQWIQSMGNNQTNERESSPFVESCNYTTLTSSPYVIFFVGNMTFNNTGWKHQSLTGYLEPNEMYALPENSPALQSTTFQFCNLSHHYTSTQYSDPVWLKNNYDQMKATCAANSGMSSSTKIWTQELWPDYGRDEPWTLRENPDRRPNTDIPLASAKMGSIVNASSISTSYDLSTGLGQVNFTNNRWRWGGQSMRIYMGPTKGDIATAWTTQTFSVYVNVTERCWGIAYIGSIPLYPHSWASLVISISVIIQAAFFLMFASFGDFGNWRKVLLLSSAYLAAGALIIVPFGAAYSSSLTVMIAVCWLEAVGMGMSLVMYNAYLPFLAKDHPDVRQMIKAKRKAAEICDQYKLVQQELSDMGYIWGYVSGVTGVIVGAAIMLFWPKSGFRIGAAFTPFLITGMKWIHFMCGVWWVVFTWPIQFLVRDRPGAKIPGNGGVLDLIIISYNRVKESAASLGMLPNSLKFFICFFLYSDGYNTIANVGIFFAQDEMGIGMTGLILLAALSPFGAGIGITIARKYHKWAKANNKFGKGAEDIVIVALIFYCIIIGYVLLGFIPGLPLGLKAEWEIFTFVVLYGAGLGTIQTYSRTTYTILIPPGQEAEFFGLYELSDKSSSWIGPLMMALFYQATGTMRAVATYLLLALGGPLIVMTTIDFEEAKKDCSSLKMAMHLKALKNKRNAGRKKGIMSFLSLNSVRSTLQSTFSGQGASAYASSTIDSLRSSVQSSTIGSSMQSSIQGSSIQSSVAPSEVGASAVSEIDEDLEAEIEDIKREQRKINQDFDEGMSVIDGDDDGIEDIDED